MGTGVHIASEGRAQESSGRGPIGNDVAAQRTLEWSKASRSGGCATRDGEEATACGDVGTATREGKALKGVASARRARSGPSDGGGRAQNPVNLMVGCRMQQACATRGGVNRHGGEEPRRRPVTNAWRRRSEAHFGAWERIPGAMSTEGRDLWTTLWKALDESRAEFCEMRLRE
jgi:hypothetical protein